MYRLVILFGVIVLAFSQGIASAATALLVGGKGIYSELSEEQMTTAFGGYFSHYDKRVSVPFPGTDDVKYSVQVGADNLYALIYATPGPKTIGGVSEGAPSVVEVLRRLEIDRADQTDGKTPPPKSELNVAIYGSPSKQFLGSLGKQPIPVTPYDIIIVTAEYDGVADFPDNPFNLLAVTNALMGGVQLHVEQSTFDIRNLPTEYTIVTNSAGGTTTTILIPTQVLPILAPMVNMGASPRAIANMDKLLRPIIDSAYKRPKMQAGIPPTLTPQRRCSRRWPRWWSSPRHAVTTAARPRRPPPREAGPRRRRRPVGRRPRRAPPAPGAQWLEHGHQRRVRTGRLGSGWRRSGLVLLLQHRGPCRRTPGVSGEPG